MYHLKSNMPSGNNPSKGWHKGDDYLNIQYSCKFTGQQKKDKDKCLQIEIVNYQ